MLQDLAIKKTNDDDNEFNEQGMEWERGQFAAG